MQPICRTRIDSRLVDGAYFSHYDQAGSTSYAIKQVSAGDTVVNAATGRTLTFSIGNASYWAINSAGNLNGSSSSFFTLPIKGSEPSGSNGQMYYSTALNKFRVYENGAWAKMKNKPNK